MPAASLDHLAIVSVRLLSSATETPQCRRWEVTCGNEATGWRIVGWIEERQQNGTRQPLYVATGVHPSTGKHCSLGVHADFDQQANAVADFYLNPSTSRSISWTQLSLDGD